MWQETWWVPRDLISLLIVTTSTHSCHAIECQHGAVLVHESVKHWTVFSHFVPIQYLKRLWVWLGVKSDEEGMGWPGWSSSSEWKSEMEGPIQEPLQTSFFPLILCYRWDCNCFPAVCPVLPTLFRVIQQPCEYNNKERKLRLTTVKWLEKVTQPGKVRAKIQV